VENRSLSVITLVLTTIRGIRRPGNSILFQYLDSTENISEETSQECGSIGIKY
jgi:hypothetical protein